jgi:hypothetical protein
MQVALIANILWLQRHRIHRLKVELVHRNPGISLKKPWIEPSDESGPVCFHSLELFSSAMFARAFQVCNL